MCSDTACLLAVEGFPCSFPCCCEEKHLDPKSGQEVDPEMLGCGMSCRGNETDLNFLVLFSGFSFPTPDFYK